MTATKTSEAVTHNAQQKTDIFWLHVKKSGGTSIMERLGDAYVNVDRNGRPTCFIAAEKRQWNDILNNFRVVLGDYTFKRTLFAKKFLYTDEWDSLLKFAVSREPVARCVSMFHYLFLRKGALRNQAFDLLTIYRKTGKVPLTQAYAFDLFLDVLDYRFSEKQVSIYDPISLHFTTHTARMWDDVTDEAGNILLDRIYRLECADKGIEECLAEVGKKPNAAVAPRKNAFEKSKYKPTKAQIKRIEALYPNDFDLYERALVR